MSEVSAVLDREISARRLLDHPFYQRWTAGTLTMGELREYARQYYHYAVAFPTFLSAMHSHTPDVATRQLLLENLVEEERGPENHPELWLRFCEALGLERDDVENAQPNDATKALIACMHSLARDGALHAVHMDADVVHSQTSRELLNRLCDSPAKTAEARNASSRTLSALYGFLDACATMA